MYSTLLPEGAAIERLSVLEFMIIGSTPVIRTSIIYFCFLRYWMNLPFLSMANLSLVSPINWAFESRR